MDRKLNRRWIQPPLSLHALPCAALPVFEGIQLLPESYAALIFSHMDLSPPDVAVAKALYGALAGTDTDAQPPWAVLCRLLAAKGFAHDAVAIVQEGLAAGLQLDPDVAEAYVKALCDTQQSVSRCKGSCTLTTQLCCWVMRN